MTAIDAVGELGIDFPFQYFIISRSEEVGIARESQCTSHRRRKQASRRLPAKGSSRASACRTSPDQ